MLPTRSQWVLSSVVSCLAAAIAPASSGAQGEAGAQGAQAQLVAGAAVDVTILRTVNLPWQQPEVILKTLQPLDSLHVELVIDAAQGPSADLWRLPDGTTRSLDWHAAPGRHRCDVRVSGMRDGNNFRQVFSANVDIVAPLEVKLTAQDVDLQARTLRLHAKSELSFAELTIYDVDGHVLHQASTRFEKSKPAQAAELSWPELSAPAAKIAVRAFNSADTWADVEWTPIQIEVPHEPIYLQDGAVVGGERSKYAAAYRDVIDALRAHGKVPGLRLYVVGLTHAASDTTTAADRARDLASYFEQRGGITLPILVGGSVDPGAEVASVGQVQAILALQAPSEAQWVELSAPRSKQH
ncbi:MAG TPA: hypothetical protein VF331_16995 [Polyangiales bacterium]